MQYLDTLNTAQRQAVEQTEGPVMVIAGAGSGKTRVLTFRIAHIINKGVDPFHILALTFTNKAAKEMKDRIAKIVGGSEAKNIWMGTFHSVFAKILRFEAEKLNYPSNFSIYDTQDSKSLLGSIIKEMELDDKIYKVSIVMGRISSAKNNLIDPWHYAQDAGLVGDDRAAGRPKMADIYLAYWNRCYKAGAMDFDDLLFKTNVLLRDFPDVLYKYQQKFRYIMVDEYQDTNHAQYLIVKKLAALYQNLCVVGDDAQSIYAFRGANIQNILNFKTDYPDFRLFKLEQNYRSTKMIVKAANSVIEKNKTQIKKDVWTSNDEGQRIYVKKSLSDNDEGNFVANTIFETQFRDQATPHDFAILYRTNAQSRALEEALRKQNIPYKIYGGLSFYQRKEIKDLTAYFRLVANHEDEEALKRVINYPIRGIGKTTLEKLVILANDNNISMWEVMNRPAEFRQAIGSSFSKLDDFATMIRSFRAELNSRDAFELGEHIAKSSGIVRELYADKSPEGVSRYENIQELLNGLKEFVETQKELNPDQTPTLSEFLLDVALLTDADKSGEDNDHVSLMTIHSAKGLEFPYVHIVGLEENLFPSQLSINSRTELEEERRLFYVALTRAEKRATLSYALTRFKWGQLQQCEPSRFLEEIDESCVEWPQVDRMKDAFQSFSSGSSSGFSSQKTVFTKRTGGPASSTPAAAAPTSASIPKNLKPVAKASVATGGDFEGDDLSILAVGMQVEHQKFGKGKVLQTEGNHPEVKATIFFPSSGQKQLLLKFAKLKIIG
ncbi:MAG: UvrD-helicase domain-containing protein [Bacteroidota bacterium]